MSTLQPLSLRRCISGVAAAASLMVAGAMAVPGVAAATTPTVSIAPGPAGGAFTDGQTVTVSVGPNSFFHPDMRVEIIECADPGGTVANLPTAFSSCDGDTHQGDSVIVQDDGSFAEPGYIMHAVPNRSLNEQANWYPKVQPDERLRPVRRRGLQRLHQAQGVLGTLPLHIGPPDDRRWHGQLLSARSHCCRDQQWRVPRCYRIAFSLTLSHHTGIHRCTRRAPVAGRTGLRSGDCRCLIRRVVRRRQP